MQTSLIASLLLLGLGEGHVEAASPPSETPSSSKPIIEAAHVPSLASLGPSFAAEPSLAAELKGLPKQMLHLLGLGAGRRVEAESPVSSSDGQPRSINEVREPPLPSPSPALEELKPSLAAELKRGLEAQALRGLGDHGQSITIMAVGQSGLGKTTFFSNLFLRDIALTKGRTMSILEQTVHFGEAPSRRPATMPGGLGSPSAAWRGRVPGAHTSGRRVAALWPLN